MKIHMKKPPGVAEWLLKKMTYYEDNFSCLENFRENYIRLFNDEGIIRARLWYWLQTLLTAKYYFSLLFYRNFIMIRNYFKVAFRNIRRNKLYSSIGITGLAIGIACSMLSFFIAYYEWSYDRFHDNRDEIYRVYEELNFANSPTRYSTSSHYPLSNFIRENCPDVIESIRYAQSPVTVRFEDKVFNIEAGLADAGFFDMFSFPLLQGDPSMAFSDPLSVIITNEFAVACFGEENPLGKTLLINNELSLEVKGVMEDPPPNTHFRVKAIAPFALMGYPGDVDEFDWGGNPLETFVLLNNGVSPQDTGEKITSLLNNNNRENIMHLQPLTEMNLFDVNGGGNIVGLLISSLISIAILFVACVNYTNLAIAGSAVRAKEIGMRKVLGAKKTDIIKQFLGETIIQTAFALGSGIIISILFLKIINSSGLYTLDIKDIDPMPALTGMVFISILTGLISGSYPSFILSSFMPANTIKDPEGAGGRRSLLRKVLVTIQFVVVIFLIIGTTFLYNQLIFIKNKDLGYEKDNIVWSRLNGSRKSSFDSIKEELLQYPIIESIAWGGESPSNIGSSVWAVDWDGKDQKERITFNFQYVDYDYLKTFKMEIVQGRDFSESFSTDKSEAYIVNELAVKTMGMDDPIGKRLSVFRNEGRIIGVVKDFHFQPLRSEIKPFVVAIGNDGWKNHVFIRVDKENTEEAMAVVNRVFDKFDPDKSFGFHFFNDLIANNYSFEEKISKIVGYFTGLLILVASLGLFGLISFTAQQRIKEIGIRKILGASSSQLILMLNKSLVTWIIISNIIAWPMAYYAVNKMFENYAYHIGMNPLYFIFAGALSFIIGLATISLKTIKTANVNPVNTLKFE
ncbi:ABC transporter permease [candidate division KSB1 bacterium]